MTHLAHRIARPRPRHDLPAARQRLLTSSLLLLTLLFVGALGVAGAQGATGGDGVTAEVLAAVVPDELPGYVRYSVDGDVDRAGGAYVRAEFDNAEDSGGAGVALNISDMGPFTEATRLMLEADVAAGRHTAADIGGYSGFVEDRGGNPVVTVLVGRMLVDASTYFETLPAPELIAAVESFPLAELEELSSLPPATGALYPSFVFERRTVRSFLPEDVLGLQRTSGFYAETHPAGVPYGGLEYEGAVDGTDAVVTLLVHDLGRVAAGSAERMAASADWDSFEVGDVEGFSRVSGEPRAVLFVDRFRVETTVEPASLSSDVAVAALADVDWQRLREFAGLVPAPAVAVDPLLDAQPDRLAPELLGDALPVAAFGLVRGDLDVDEVELEGGWSETVVSALYLDDAGEPQALLRMSDAGAVPPEARLSFEPLTEVPVGSNTAYLNDDPVQAALVIGDRLVLAFAAPPTTTITSDDVRQVFESLDLTALSSALP